MVTVAGTLAAGLLVFSVTAAPPPGAAALSVNDTCSDWPPLTPLTFAVIDDRVGGAFGSGLTLRNHDFDPAPALAVIVAPDGLDTGLVDATNVVALLPAGMRTLAGTFTTGLSLDR